MNEILLADPDGMKRADRNQKNWSSRSTSETIMTRLVLNAIITENGTPYTF